MGTRSVRFPRVLVDAPAQSPVVDREDWQGCLVDFPPRAAPARAGRAPLAASRTATVQEIRAYDQMSAGSSRRSFQVMAMGMLPVWPT